jgi:hypothetical protein
MNWPLNKITHHLVSKYDTIQAEFIRKSHTNNSNNEIQMKKKMVYDEAEGPAHKKGDEL